MQLFFNVFAIIFWSTGSIDATEHRYHVSFNECQQTFPSSSDVNTQPMPSVEQSSSTPSSGLYCSVKATCNGEELSQIPLHLSPTIYSEKGHLQVTQNSPQWYQLRKGIVTSSKMPALLGLRGSKCQDHMLREVMDQETPEDLKRKERVATLPSFKRGHQYEDKAAEHFTKESGMFMYLHCPLMYLYNAHCTCNVTRHSMKSALSCFLV